MKKYRLAIFTTHPIQYQVPWFQSLALRPELDLKVYFGMLPDAEQQGAGFDRPFQWDIPMLEGYPWKVLENARAKPDLKRFFGSSVTGIWDAMAQEPPDAAIITGWNALPLLQALWVCRRRRIPVIVRGDSNALRPRSSKARLAHRILLAQYHAFLVVGRANRDFYLGNGVDESRLFSAPHFIDNARFRASSDALLPGRRMLRRFWDVADGTICFVFAGKLEPKKRILDLVAAIAIARSKSPNLHLLVVGSGLLMEDAKALALRLHVPVTFTGFLNQTELPKAYAAGDCLVLPSDYGETWGLVVNEAMACGLPAVVSDRVGCAKDLVENGVTGNVFPFGNVDALATVLAALAARPALLLEMGVRARERVARYSVEQAVAGTLEAIRHVTREKQ